MSRPLDFLLFYPDHLHLIKKGNVKLLKSILKVIDSTITGSVWSANSKFNLEYFPTLPRIVPLCNYVSFSTFIFKDFSTSFVCPGKPTCNSNVCLSKPVGPSSVRTCKSISNRNVRPSKTFSASETQLNPFVVVMLV